MPCFAMKTFPNYISITLTANTQTLVLFITFSLLMSAGAAAPS